jgi:hypothetical protein
MKLGDALNVIQRIRTDAEPSVIYLVCGFTPLRLKMLLGAEDLATFPRCPHPA